MSADILTLADPEARFGACPHCCGRTGYVTIDRLYIIKCDEHRVYWIPETTPAWRRSGDTLADWAASIASLDGMKQIAPVYPITVSAQSKAA
jgi:hypothetical protein